MRSAVSTHALSQQVIQPQVPVASPHRAASLSQIESMMLAMDRMSPARARLLTMLLRSTEPGSCGDGQLLQPIWADEMICRADRTIRLIQLLEDRVPCDGGTADGLESRIAINLADTLCALRIERDDEARPCSVLLRHAARDLAELFGDAAGIIGISTGIERLELPAFKRRALVLMASRLLSDILLYVARERHSPLLLVTLDRPRRGIARLSIGYEDRPGLFGPIDGSDSVTDDLASLLETAIIYRADRLGRFTIGMDIPLR